MSASGNKKPENSAFKRHLERAQGVQEKAEIFGSLSGIFLKFQRVGAVGILDHWEMCAVRNYALIEDNPEDILDHWEMCAVRNTRRER